jgi:hypothetical protein
MGAYPSICPLKQVAQYAGHKVWIEVDINILLIVRKPQGILDLQLRPQPTTHFKWVRANQRLYFLLSAMDFLRFPPQCYISVSTPMLC